MPTPVRPVSPDVAAELASEWDDLADRTGAPPFVRPGWLSAWWNAFGKGRLEVHTLHRNGRLAAVLPITRRFGTLRSATNCHTPQSRMVAEDADAALELARTLFQGRPHRVFLEALTPDNESLEALKKAAEDSAYRVLVRTGALAPYLRVRGSFSAYEARLSDSLLTDLKRSRRRLERVGRVSFQVLDGGRELDALLAETYAIESSGWKGEVGTAISSRRDTHRFYTEIARWAAARNMLRIFFLRVDGAPLAVFYALEEKGICHLLKGGFDPAYRRCSPGKLLLHEIVMRGFSTGLSRIEFHGDRDAYKLQWTNCVQARQWFDAFSRSAAGSVAWTSLACLRPAVRNLLAGFNPHRRTGIVHRETHSASANSNECPGGTR